AWSGVPRYAGFAAYEKTGAGTWRLTGGNGPEGGFEARQRYVILTAGQRRGQFDAVGSGYAYLAPALSYDATSVALILQRRGAP
ncbi:hypothetical protein, partial [Bordetella pertussis]|uniref:hypothetical protein n=1 Tax=Bordetella pertussis TaxID=520 RepID=UPI0012B180C7